MRKLSEITTSILPPAPAGRSYPRRPVKAFYAGITCLALVNHQESASKKALYVSDDGDVLNAVWVPKALLGLDKKDRGRFLVATVSKAFADRKQLDFGRFKAEWAERLLPDERAQFDDAQQVAKLSRQRFRGDATSRLSHFGRNEFA
jgi:hypothetical protein